MTRPITAWISGALSLAPLAAGVWALGQVPADQLISIHFDVYGHPNGWAPARVGLFILPVVAIAMWALRFLVPKITPRGETLNSSGAFATIWMTVTFVLVLGQGLIVASALGYRIDLQGVIPVMTGLFFIVIGNVLPKLRWNYLVGIRTPWTLADERVWDKTHRFGGWTMVLGGIALLISAALFPHAPPELAVAVGLGVAMLTTAKSYLLWRDIQAPRPR